MINEHDRIVLTKDLPGGELLAGDVGVVVHIYPNARASEVEFMTFTGTTIAVATVPAENVRPVSESDVRN